MFFFQTPFARITIVEEFLKKTIRATNIYGFEGYYLQKSTEPLISTFKDNFLKHNKR